MPLGQFQHTAARRRLRRLHAGRMPFGIVSTHSRPKAAASRALRTAASRMFQHTAARRRLRLLVGWGCLKRGFQHTAARRRLRLLVGWGCLKRGFQHTAARRRLQIAARLMKELICFNTQPPEGGCLPKQHLSQTPTKFQHTAARRRLHKPPEGHSWEDLFQHTAARRRLLD